MSLSRTSSSSSLPLPNKGELSGQDESSANKEKQDAPKDAGVEKSRASGTVDKTDKKKESGKKLAPPVVRTQVRMKLSQRERSVSSPVLIRPLPSDPDSMAKQSQTPDAKASTSSRQSKEIDTDRPLKQPKQDDDRLPSSPPKLRSKQSQLLLKPLTTEQQLASDLADLMGKIFLRKKEKVDDEIPVSQMTASLQRFAGKPADAKVRITDLMLKMFSDVMKKSEAWDIASQIMVTIRREYFQGRDEKSVLNTRLEKEATDMLALLASNFAGAFFNVSGNDEKNRLPEPIRLFLHAADHQQIRVLLSTPAGIAMSKEEFLRGRRDWLAKVLIQTFLKPLVLKEFSLESGTIESTNTADHIIQALHIAFKTSAQSILVDSLRSPPDDITELMFQRRANQFRPRADGQEQDAQSDGKKSQISTGRSSLMKTTSPNHKRRVELNRFLNNTLRQLAPVTLPNDMLEKIKAFNNEFSASSGRIDYESLLRSWLNIAKKSNAESPAVGGLKALLDDQIEQSNIDTALLEAELTNKLVQLEAIGQEVPLERARRLSSDLPLVSVPESTTSLTPPVNASSSTTSRANRPRATRSPASPVRHTQHKRSKTADVTLPEERTLSSGLTVKEREVLIQAFPDLLIDAVKRTVVVKTKEEVKMKPNPVRAIAEGGRGKLALSLRSLSSSLKVKLREKFGGEEKSDKADHAELWKLLMMDAIVESRVGRIFLKDRSEILKSVGTSIRAGEMTKLHPDEHTEKRNLSKKMKSQVDLTLTTIFGKGLAEAGLPEELLGVLKALDKKLLTWLDQDPGMKQKLQEWTAKNPTATQSGIDTIRSAIGYDLVITRLIYPLTLGKVGFNPSVSQLRFAEAIRSSLKPLWDKQLFNELKAIHAANATNDNAATSSSTSQTPSAQQ